MAQRIIIFGGTFDPIHNGHLITARCVAEAVGSGSVLFVPAAANPLKAYAPESPEHRLAMLQAATSNDDLFAIDDFELYRAPPSFTIDTVRHFRGKGVKNLAMIIGADMLCDLPQWREIDELLDIARLLIASRPPESPDDLRKSINALAGKLSKKQIASLKESVIATPMTDISSTEIRRRVAAGESVRGMTPLAVQEYIMEYGLYQT